MVSADEKPAKRPRVSEAEEALRLKTEKALRKARPDARIIHELVLTQGGERIDLAAVWPDGIIIAELKSEKDTLTRLPAQLRASLALGCEVWLCLAEKWRPHIEALNTQSEEAVSVTRKGYTYHTHKPNPAYIAELNRVAIAYEKPDHIEFDNTWNRRERFPPADGGAMLEMLWAEELRAIKGTHPRDPRRKCINAAREYLSGQEVRRACCAALLARNFPRADPPRSTGVSDASGLFTKQRTVIARAADSRDA